MAQLWTVATGLALALALAACNGGDDSVPTPEPATPTPSVTPTPGADEPQVIDGVEVVPLEFGGEVELPDDVALIVETGCTECDGGTTGLIRVYRDASGDVRTDPLFDVDLLGLPPRNISTFGLNSDASDIVVGVCTQGYCGPFNAITADAQTTLFRSLDGGVTWAEFAVLDGAYNVGAIAKDGVVLTGPYDADPDTFDHPGYQLFPSGDPLEPPAQAGLSWPISLPSGDLLWPTEDGRLLRSDGSEFLALGEGIPANVRGRFLRPDPRGGRLPLVIWIDRPSEYSVGYYLGVVDSEGHLIKAFALDGFASVGGWLNHGVIVGNAVVPADRLMAVPPKLSAEYLTLPALIDLGAGRVQPISDPFLDRYGRNLILAVVQGPFARVVDTGGCLNVRAEAGPDGDVLGCVADDVLLRDTGQTREVDGVNWLYGVTPSGVEGWASMDYLER